MPANGLVVRKLIAGGHHLPSSNPHFPSILWVIVGFDGLYFYIWYITRFPLVKWHIDESNSNMPANGVVVRELIAGGHHLLSSNPHAPSILWVIVGFDGLYFWYFTRFSLVKGHINTSTYQRWVLLISYRNIFQQIIDWRNMK